MKKIFEHSVPLRPQPEDYFKVGDVALVFTSYESVAKNLEKVLSVENTMVQGGPKISTYPNYDGTGLITVNSTTIVDPDGHLVEINQILDGLGN